MEWSEDKNFAKLVLVSPASWNQGSEYKCFLKTGRGESNWEKGKGM